MKELLAVAFSKFFLKLMKSYVLLLSFSVFDVLEVSAHDGKSSPEIT